MSSVGLQCAVCGCWDGDGEPANDVQRYDVIREWVDVSEHRAGRTEDRMWLCQDCVAVDPIIDTVDVFGNEERAWLA